MEILSEEFEDNSIVKGLVENNDAFLKMINKRANEIAERIDLKELGW